LQTQPARQPLAPVSSTVRPARFALPNINIDGSAEKSMAWTAWAGLGLQVLGGWLLMQFLAYTAMVGLSLPSSASVLQKDWPLMLLLLSMVPFGILHLIVGSKIRRGRPQARTVGILLAIFGLLNVAVGTVIGFAILLCFALGRNEKSIAV
jgi:hypothetical protein